MMNDTDTPQHLQRFKELLENSRVLALATLNEQQLPEASQTPFLYFEKKLWVYTSRLSPHTQNLHKQAVASVLISAEAPQGNPFAIVRSSIQCLVEEEHNQSLQNRILNRMKDKLGDTVSLLQQLPDFHLLALLPQCGRFIQGFGQAFEIDFDSMTLTHIGPDKNS